MSKLHALEKVEWVDPKTLKPHPKNPNKHTKEQVERLAKILKYQGFRKAITISKLSGFITTGHCTTLAAMHNKWERVPVCYQDFEDETQEFAHIVADNAAAAWAELDLAAINTASLDFGPFDTDLLGIKGWEPVAEDKYEGKDADSVPDVAQNELDVKLGDLYQLGDHRLLCGDSTEAVNVETVMNGIEADLWLTDPPYGVSYEARSNDESGKWANKKRISSKVTNDDLALSDMKVFWTKAARCAFNACTDKASYYWFACQGGDQMMMMMMAISDSGWKVRHELIWVKDQMVFGRCDYHYKHEPILYGWKQEGTHEWHGDRKQTSLLECPRPKSSDLHPTMKPIELLDVLIKNNTKQGALVLDTFLGSGSTLIACEKTNRKCFGMELDPHYCSVIIKRWEAFTGRQAIKL